MQVSPVLPPMDVPVVLPQTKTHSPSSARRRDAEQGAGTEACPNSRSVRVLVWLLRATGHCGGRGGLATVYALLLYAPISCACLWTAVDELRAGRRQMAATGAFFAASFYSNFFGLTHVLAWVPVTCTFLAGRRRYKALLAEIRRTLAETVGVSSTGAVCTGLRRLSRRLLALTVAVTGFVLANHLLQLGIGTRCAEGPAACARTALFSLLLAALDLCLFFIPVKLCLATALLCSGFEILAAELQSLAARGPVCRLRLVRLRRRQEALSSLARRLMDGMRIELVPCMLYGMTMQVSTYLLAVLAARSQNTPNGPLFVLSIYRAAFMLIMPCESAQQLQNRCTRLRDSQLRLHADDVAANQELLLLLETTRRDLDSIGDLALYRLQRPTILAISSTVITYLIVLVQFQLTEQSGTTAGPPTASAPQ